MNTNFHTINYYHKIIIQYIYLSYVKNDLVKIEESILDYHKLNAYLRHKKNKKNLGIKGLILISNYFYTKSH